MNDNSITLNLNPKDFLIRFDSKLIECSNAVYFGMNALEITNELPETLNSDVDNSIFIHSPLGEMSLDTSKENFRNWVLKKGFEDLIIALTELLLSFSNVIDMNKEIQSKGKMTFSEFQEVIFNPYYESSKENFPNLLKKVNDNLKTPMSSSEEINSINRVRRCLAHRNGLVTHLDFNSNDSLELRWKFVELYLIEDDIKKPLERFDIIMPKTKLETNEVHKSKVFKLNEHIVFSFQEYNELIFFCKQFGDELVAKFELK